MSRLKEAIALSMVAPLALSACGRGRGETPQPITTSTAPSAAVSISERPPSPIGSPAASGTVKKLEGPANIRNGLQTARTGDVFILNKPVIGSIQRLGSNYKATVDTQTESESNQDVTAFVSNGQCIFDAFNDAKKLRAPLLGVWKVGEPVDELKVDVTDPYPSSLVKTIVHADQVKLGDKTYDCQ